MSKVAVSFFGCLCALVPLAGFAQTSQDLSDLTTRLKAYRYGGDAAVLDALASEVKASRADTARRTRVAQELATVLTSDAPFEAKQFACRQLAFIGTEAQVPALTRLLSDDMLAHYALMALARIPGASVDEALRSALAHSHGRTELELMGALADRGDTGVTPALAFRLRASDPATADAAAASLAKLATPAALEALRRAYPGLSGARQLCLGYALLEGADRLRQRGDLAAAAAIYGRLEGEQNSPLIRAVALRGLARTRPAAALPQIRKALGEDGTPDQTTAARLVRELPGPKMTEAFATILPTLTPRGKQLLLAALADRGDSAAATGVRAQCSSPDIAVRVAALRALGALGNVSSITTLLPHAAAGTPQEREAAQESLAELHGQAVDARLLTLLDTAPAAERAEIVAALGRRHAAEALPRLLREARSPMPAVRSAALRVLRDMGQPSLLPQLVDLLLATPPADRDAAIDTVSEIARRGADEGQRTGVLMARLQTAAKPDDKTALLTLLGQVGGPNALSALRAALADPDAGVRATSLSLLADWPTDEPLNDLLRATRAAQDDRQRALALSGYLRMIGAGEGRAPAQTLALYREVALLATRPDEKRLLLAGLAKTRSLAALEFAGGFAADEAVRAEAETAIVAIGECTLGAWPDKTRAALAPIAQHGVNEATRKQAAATLARLDKIGDFIPAWEVSPAYQRDGADYTRLFDLAFAPEEPASAPNVDWQPMPIGTNPDQPWLLDLLALWGGEERVAYLRSAVWSANGRELVLELGSDDGVKAWWNGQVVLAHNVARAVAPAEEKVTVGLRPGWNILLLKITQHNQGWGACASFTTPDGAPVTGLRYSIPSEVVVNR